MRTYLVTGGAGFIGSNYIHYMFKKYDNEIRIINVDKLTYAGNLENLKDIENRDNYTFVKADICDKERADEQKRQKNRKAINHKQLAADLPPAYRVFIPAVFRIISHFFELFSVFVSFSSLTAFSLSLARKPFFSGFWSRPPLAPLTSMM